ncbi:hypothetical protein OQA88_9448 [Cercophora sp. LCS_1]
MQNATKVILGDENQSILDLWKFPAVKDLPADQQLLGAMNGLDYECEFGVYTGSASNQDMGLITRWGRHERVVAKIPDTGVRPKAVCRRLYGFLARPGIEWHMGVLAKYDVAHYQARDPVGGRAKAVDAGQQSRNASFPELEG